MFVWGCKVKLTNVDSDKYGYSGDGIGFDAISQFSFLISDWGKKVVIFGVGNSSSRHIANRKIISLFLVKRFLYANSLNIYHFKAKDSEKKPYELCLDKF